MERLTERFDNGQAAVKGCGENCKYDYRYCRNHYEDCPEINRIYDKLAEYEDTGLTPEQIVELAERDTMRAPEHAPTGYGMICPVCGNLVQMWQKYCGGCGQKLRED